MYLQETYWIKIGGGNDDSNADMGGEVTTERLERGIGGEEVRHGRQRAIYLGGSS